MSDTVASIRTSDANGQNSDGEAIVDRLRRCVERVSLGFERWTDPYAQGPGLYFVVERTCAAEFAEPMGSNRWPVEDCVNVAPAVDVLSEAAEKIALTCDGAVMIHNDGTIEEEMVRIKQLSPGEREQHESLPYAGWMGARHMSALETSTREEILAAVTLSEEDGRMTIFRDGTVEDYPRDALERE